MATGLQALNYNQLISGGYIQPDGTPEEVSANGQYNSWTDVDLTGIATSTYTYRDSDYSLNYNSTRVRVGITDRWSAVKNDDNSFTITVESWLEYIVRDNRRGFAGTVGRSIFVRQRRNDNNWLASWPNTPINAEQTIYPGRLHLGSKQYVLYPEEESDQGSLYYRNNVSGYDWVVVPPTSIYVDELYMGIRFRNNLPKKLHPPVMERIDQAPDICHYKVNTDFTISMDDIPDSNSHTVHMQIGVDSQFRDAKDYYANIKETVDGMTYFEITDVLLKPNTRYYYRVQLNQPDVYETDWRTGSFTTIAVIKPKEVAPAFSEDDCENLTTNQEVAQWPDWS